MKFQIICSLLILFYQIILGISNPSTNIWSDHQHQLFVNESVINGCGNIMPKTDYQALMQYFRKGDSLFMDGRVDEAYVVYLKALNIAREHKLVWPGIIITNRLGYMFYWSSRINLAQKYYYESFEQIKNDGNIIDTLATIEAQIFCEYFRTFGKTRFSELSDILTSADINNYSSHESIRKLKFCILSAIYYTYKLNPSLVQNYLKEAELIIKKKDSEVLQWLFQFQFLRALNLVSFFDQKLSCEFLEELYTQTEHNDRLRMYQYHVSNNLSWAYFDLHDFDSMIRILQPLGAYIKLHLEPFFYEYYLRLGYAYEAKGNITKAINLYNTAEKLVKDKPEYLCGLMKVYLYKSSFYKGPGKNRDLALVYLSMAKKIADPMPDMLYYKLFITYDLIDNYRLRGDYKKILEYCNTPALHKIDSMLENMQLESPSFDNTILDIYINIIDIRGFSLYCLSKEDKENELLYLLDSYKSYKKLIEISEVTYAKMNYDRSKLNNLKMLRISYSDLINVVYSLYCKTKNPSLILEMFDITEMSRAVILKNYLTEDIAKIKAGIPKSMIEKTNYLKKQIDTMQYVFRMHNSKQMNTENEVLMNRIVEKYNEYNDCIRQLEKKYPAYAKIKAEARHISLKQVQNNLSEEQAIIEYHATIQGIYTFYIDKTSIKIFYTDKKERDKERIRDYQNIIKNTAFGVYSGENLDRFIHSSNQLYRLLIGPLEHLIQNKQLLIIPDGELYMIPFETLLVRNSSSDLTISGFSHLPYLILHHPISYLYSTVQVSGKSQETEFNVRFAGFAPNYNQCSKKKGKPEWYDSVYFSDLSGAQKEIVFAGKYFRGNVFIEEEANKANFFRAISKYDIIHLAMHSSLDMEEPMYSKLFFSPEYNNDEKQLFAYELFWHRIKARLVVLSACNTGKGIINEGEGILSFARAFFLSGSRNVVLTHWSVTDLSSACLMEKFYYYLSKGYAIDIAMQKAKTEIILKGDPVKAHPYYWAGYVSYGMPFTIRNNYIMWICIIIAVIILVCSYFIIRRRIKVF